MDGIFISYRRDDSAGYAGRLYDRLSGHFGAERVFMDVEGIEPGADFVEAIEAAVSSCRVLIVIIGSEWTQATDAAGRRRLDDANDFIRLETGAALQRGIRVVPVLVDGAVMPRVEELPEDIKSLARRQAIEISHKQWEASTGELIGTLEGLLANPGSTASAQAVTPIGKTAAPTGAGNGAAESGGKRTPAWPLLAVVAIAVVGGGLWFGLNRRGADTSATARPPPLTAAKPDALANPKPAPKSESPTAIIPAVPSAPAPKPASLPVAEQPTTTQPVIRSFKAESTPAGVRLCYRVSNADSLTLSPRPGALEKPDQDCVSVAVDNPTTFTLTARNAGQVTRKTLAVAPRPQVAATPAARSAPAVPTAEPVPAAVSALPFKGERWIYRSSGKWASSPKRQIEIMVQSVANGVVTDALRIIEPASASSNEERRSRGKQADFVSWSGIGIEFSPYFGAFVDLASQDALSGFPTPDLDGQWRGWHSTLKILGRESVSVPAGNFETFKLEVWSSRHSTGSRAEAHLEPVRVHYLIWYAAPAKRYVKMQRRITSADSTESEKDVFELLSHTLP